MSAKIIIPAHHSQEYSTLMRFGDLDFRFRWVPTLLLAVPIPIFMALGFWQLDRAEQKRELTRTLSARSEMPPAQLTQMVTDPQALRFRRLVAQGELEPDSQILIENRRHGGRTGFHVVTPLRIGGSDVRVLVNRGWIPAGPDGAPVPAPVPEGPVTVSGETHIPLAPALVLHGGPDAAAAWGNRWPYLTVELFTSRADYPVQPVVILQDPADVGGFERTWPRELPKEGMHVGYALQWFAFALIALVLYLRLSLVRTGQEEDVA
ncbi:MAG: SURF1 family protein [Pseudomonadota bacterium]|nr:SURF1 family protein [Pseudomonadota bacterium]